VKLLFLHIELQMLHTEIYFRQIKHFPIAISILVAFKQYKYNKAN